MYLHLLFMMYNIHIHNTLKIKVSIVKTTVDFRRHYGQSYKKYIKYNSKNRRTIKQDYKIMYTSIRKKNTNLKLDFLRLY